MKALELRSSAGIKLHDFTHFLMPCYLLTVKERSILEAGRTGEEAQTG